MLIPVPCSLNLSIILDTSFTVTPAMYIDSSSESKGPKILGVFWALTSITLITVISRLYIRAGVLRNMGPDDWLIAASMVSPSAHFGVMLFENRALTRLPG